MHDYSSQLKEEFIKKWIKGLQICCSSSSSSKKQMNIMERKKKIKLSADIALASAKNGTTSWSRALLSDIQKDEQNKLLVNNVLGPESKLVGTSSQLMVTNYCHKRLIFRSKKFLKKRCGTGASKRMRKKKPAFRPNLASCIAKRLVNKRTQVLKGLVPGGESMDEFSIIKEALDYILSLRVQVDVMKDLVNATNVV